MPVEECPVVGCGCDGCEYCRGNHDERTRCRCECDFAQKPEPPVEAGAAEGERGPTKLESLANSWWAESVKNDTVIRDAGIWQRCAFELRAVIATEALAQGEKAEPANPFSETALKEAWDSAIRLLEESGEDVPALLAQAVENVRMHCAGPPGQGLTLADVDRRIAKHARAALGERPVTGGHFHHATSTALQLLAEAAEIGKP